MLKCCFFFNDRMIGSADLHLYDRTMGVIGDKFQPSNGYKAIHQQIQSTTLRNDLTNQSFIIAQTIDGIILDSVAGVKIQDYPELQEIEISINGLHWQIIEQYFSDLPDVAF